MPDNNTVGGIAVKVRLDDKDALRQLARLRQKIEDTQKSLAAKRAQRDSIAAEMEKAEVAAERARQKVKTLQAELAAASPADRAGIRARLTAANADLREQAKNLDSLNRQWQKLDGEIAAGETNLTGMTDQAGMLETQVRANSGAVAHLRTAVARAGKAMERTFKRVGRMISRVFLFTTILRGLRALREYLGTLLMSFPAIRDALAEIKGNLLTAAQPIVERLVPAVETLLGILVQVSAVLADIVSKIFGTTAAKSRESAAALNDQTKAYKNAGSAAQKASRQLASFDELNVLSGSSAASTGSGSGGSGSGEIEPKFSGGFMSEMEDQIGALELLVGGASLALGAILTFTGANIPLGIGLLALGAASIAAAASLNWDTLSKQLQGPIGKIFALVSGAALVLGAILAFSGVNLPLGIALMVIGAAGLATATAANWSAIEQELSGPFAGIYALISGAVLVIGAILVFSGISLPLGIALMAAGAAGLATVTALNWEKIKAQLQGPIGAVVAIASGALLAMGVVIAFSGVGLPLGIALMAAGAAGLATVTALNWETIKAKLQGPMGEIAALASGALLVLGIILTIAGVLPLGIALIAAGAAGLVTVTALNWDAVKEKIVGIWDSIKNWWKTHVAPIFTREWWAEKFSSIKEGLTAKIKDGINAAIDLLNTFIAWMNDKLHLSWGSFSLFGKEIIPAGEFQLLTIPQIPRLAQGAVIPPNREFMAVLGDQKSGTNVETPLATMVDAFKQALREGGGGSRTVVFQIDRREFARMTFDLYNAESRRVGPQFGGGR